MKSSNNININNISDLPIGDLIDCSWTYNFLTRSITLSKTFWGLLGFSYNNDIIYSDETWSYLIHPEDKNSFFTKLHECKIDSHNLIKLYLRFRTSSRSWKCFLTHGKVTRNDSHGKPIEAIGTYIDVTDLFDLHSTESNSRLSLGDFIKQVLHTSNKFKNIIALHDKKQTVAGPLIHDIGQKANRIRQNELAKRRETEKLFHDNKFDITKLADTVVQISWITDTDAQFEYVNRQWIDFTGLTLQESIAGQWQTIIHPDDRDIVLLLTDNNNLQDGFIEFEIRLRRIDGEYIWHLSRSFPVYNSDSDIVNWVITAININSQKQIEHAIQNAREFSENIVNTIHEPLLVLDEQLRVKSANNSFFRTFNTGFDELYNRSFNKILQNSFNIKELLVMLELIIPNNNKIENYIIIYKNYKNEIFNFSINASQVIQKTTNPPLVLVAFRDLTNIKQAEDKIRLALEEKNILLNEVHHRVKNNLQIVSSLLNLQMSYLKNDQDKRLIKTFQNRIYSMALVHEQLYQSDNISCIDFKEYVFKLVNKLNACYNDINKAISFTINIPHVKFNLDIAIPCGMIINELISNAIRYAFPNKIKGNIIITLKSSGDKFQLMVKDNGIGLPHDYRIDDDTTLGMRLINALILQINGTLRFTSGRGCRFYITFHTQPITD